MIRESSHWNAIRLLEAAIERFQNATILVVGDIILDEYLWGDVTRISPEAPVPVVEVKRASSMLGGAANVLHNIVSLGAKCILCGAVGDDSNGRTLLKRLREMGCRTEGILVERDRPTSVKTRIVAQNQQVVRFDRESRKDLTGGGIGKILGFISEIGADIDGILIADYGKGVICGPMMKGLMGMVQERGPLVAVDPKTGNFDAYRGVDILTPNHHEAGAFCRFDICDDETLAEAGKKMLRDLECRSVLITQGKDGMTLFQQDGEVTHIPTEARKVYDVTGAGDTVISVMSLGLATGLDPESAARISNIAAGIVVGEVGTTVVKTEELKRALQRMGVDP